MVSFKLNMYPVKGRHFTNRLPGVGFPVAENEKSNPVHQASWFDGILHSNTSRFNFYFIRFGNPVPFATLFSTTVQARPSDTDSWDMDTAFWNGQ
jgi:hypothetical protein